MAIAILKYRLWGDIEIAFIRTSLFFIYILVFGIPIMIYHQLWGKIPLIVPMLLMGVLASAGPFVYRYVQRRVERRFLEEQRRYQDALRNAATDINRIKKIQKVYKSIVDLIAPVMKVEYALVYTLDEEKKEYSLQASEYAGRPKVLPEKISMHAPVAEYLKQYRRPVDYNDAYLKTDITRDLSKSGFYDALVLPVLMEDEVQAMIVAGKKKNGRIFTRDDVSVLMTLADQTALAMENCRHWAGEISRMEELDLKERSVSLDMMAASLAHEIHNPNTIIINESEYLKEVLDKDKSIVLPDALRHELHKTLDFIIDSAKRVSAIVEAILEYSRIGKGELKPVNITRAVDDFLKIITPQVKKEGVHFQVEAGPNVPLIVGNKIQLEEVFMNLTLNALHAVGHNEGRPKIVKLEVFPGKEDHVRIEITDNGYGIPAEILDDIFLASVTTKGSSEGEGLGLYRVRKIIDSHKGKVWAESEGKGKGAKFVVELPVYKKDIPSNKDEGSIPKIRKLR
ncbi:MAG: GAF domain-containing protein [Candidatus Omnitrophica bacterium]|nr:GAF domain-containing protein [Candidatus Omnitrophota bacterium]